MTQPATTPNVSAPSPTPTAPSACDLPPIPPEALKFAEEVGVAPYLPGVLAMTRRAFSPAEVAVILLDDPEIEDFRHVAFDIDITGWTAERLLEAHYRWSAGIVDHCPTTHTIYFTYVTRARR
jgi:hypothetical protein